MKIRFVVLGALYALAWAGVHAQDPAAAAAAAPDPNHNLVGLSTPNGRLVYDFIDLWFNQHKPEQAFDKYVSRTAYLNHAVYNATTATVNHSFAQEKAEEARGTGPGMSFAIKQIVAQGNLVFVHIAAVQGGPPEASAGSSNPPPSPGPAASQQAGPGPVGDGKGPDEMIIIMRVKDGKVVDDWDVHVPTNSNSIVFSYLDR